jgi:hypothetical protein
MAALRAALALGLTGPALAQALGFEEREAAPEAPATPALPSLRDCAKRYLDEDTAHLASPTQRDREIMLREDGSLLRYFGDVALDAITPAMLREWWGAEILGRRAADGTADPYHRSTGRGYVNVLAVLA